MKWFQHQTNMSDTDYGLFIKSKYGFNGYARLCIILEKVAANIDKEHRYRCYRELPTSEWRRFLGINNKQLISLLDDMKRFKVFDSNSKELQLLNYEISEKLLKIEIPILYDWCDNHTKNSNPKEKNLQVTNKQELELKSELQLNPKLNIENNNLVKLKLNYAFSDEKNIELEEQVSKIHDFYKVLFDRPKYQLTEKRRKKIKARFSEPATGIIPWSNNRFLELLVAITEVSLTDFNMGKNDQQKTYIELDEHCCRNQEQVEQRLNQAFERGNLEKIERYLRKEGYLNEEITS